MGEGTHTFHCSVYRYSLNPSGFQFAWGPIESPWFSFSKSFLKMDDRICVFYSFFKKFLGNLLISNPIVPLWFLSVSENFLVYEVQNSQIFVSSIQRFSCSLIFHLTSRIRSLSFPLFLWISLNLSLSFH